MEAIKPEAPLVHPDLGDYSYVEAAFSPQPGTNIANLTKMRKGDIEKGFAEAEWVIEREYTNPSVQHVPMETHVAIVQWKLGDDVTIWTSAQSPFTVRSLFCTAMRLPLNQVRVVIPTSAVGSAARPASTSNRSSPACRARPAGDPVKMQATREEEFSLLPCRSALTYRIKTGVRSDGRITAQQMTMFWDAGAYADYAVNVTRASGYSAGRSLRDPQRLARRLHDLHQQALRHRLPRLRPRRVLLGPRASHGARRAGDRHGPAWSSAARTCSSPGRSR